MKKQIFALVWLCMACVPVCSQTYQELCDRALTWAEQDSLEAAKDCIRQALKLDPANPYNAFLFSNLGTIQRLQQQYELAVESYTYALNIQPTSVPILLNRAAIYLELKRNNLAQADYTLALDVEKDNEEALLMRAYIYAQQNNHKMARADYEHLLRLKPYLYEANLGLATLEQKAGNYKGALSILNSMLSSEEGKFLLTTPQMAVVHVARAHVERDMGHPDIALTDLDEAIRMDASLKEAYMLRGEIYLSQKRKRQAKFDFEQALALGVPPADLKDFLRRCR